MQVKKITAKIRDMVRVSLMENGDERAWYNNIEMPDAIKELEMKDFRFNVLMDGKIEFQIIFEEGVLPKVFPEKKGRNHRAAMVADTPAATPAPIPEAKPTTPLAAPDAKPAPATKPDTTADTKPITPQPKASTKADKPAAQSKAETKAAPKAVAPAAKAM